MPRPQLQKVTVKSVSKQVDKTHSAQRNLQQNRDGAEPNVLKDLKCWVDIKDNIVKRVMWRNWFGIRPAKNEDDQRIISTSLDQAGGLPACRMMTNAAYEIISKYPNQFISGIDFHNLPAGFYIKTMQLPEKHGNSNVPNLNAQKFVPTQILCYDPLLLDNTVTPDVFAVSFVAREQSIYPENVVSDFFKESANAWQLFERLNKVRKKNINTCSEAELRDAVYAFFDNEIARGLSADSVATFIENIPQDEAYHPIVLLSRWMTLLSNPFLSENNIQEQFDNLLGLELQHSHKFQVIGRVLNQEKPLTVITQDMLSSSPMDNVSFIDVLDPSRGLEPVSLISIEKETKGATFKFFRYVGFQYNRLPIAEYQNVIQKASFNKLSLPKQAAALRLIAQSTTGAAHGYLNAAKGVEPSKEIDTLIEQLNKLSETNVQDLLNKTVKSLHKSTPLVYFNRLLEYKIQNDMQQLEEYGESLYQSTRFVKDLYTNEKVFKTWFNKQLTFAKAVGQSEDLTGQRLMMANLSTFKVQNNQLATYIQLAEKHHTYAEDIFTWLLALDNNNNLTLKDLETFFNSLDNDMGTKDLLNAFYQKFKSNITPKSYAKLRQRVLTNGNLSQEQLLLLTSGIPTESTDLRAPLETMANRFYQYGLLEDNVNLLITLNGMVLGLLVETGQRHITLDELVSFLSDFAALDDDCFKNVTSEDITTFIKAIKQQVGGGYRFTAFNRLLSVFPQGKGVSLKQITMFVEHSQQWVEVFFESKPENNSLTRYECQQIIAMAIVHDGDVEVKTITAILNNVNSVLEGIQQSKGYLLQGYKASSTFLETAVALKLALTIDDKFDDKTFFSLLRHYAKNPMKFDGQIATITTSKSEIKTQLLKWVDYCNNEADAKFQVTSENIEILIDNLTNGNVEFLNNPPYPPISDFFNGDNGAFAIPDDLGSYDYKNAQINNIELKKDNIGETARLYNDSNVSLRKIITINHDVKSYGSLQDVEVAIMQDFTQGKLQAKDVVVTQVGEAIYLFGMVAGKTELQYYKLDDYEVAQYNQLFDKATRQQSFRSLKDKINAIDSNEQPLIKKIQRHAPYIKKPLNTILTNLGGYKNKKTAELLNTLLAINDNNEAEQDAVKLQRLSVCIEMLSRAQGQTLRPVQVAALVAMVLHQDKRLMSQIDTGEGKSRIMATLAAYQALSGETVDLLTSSIELAERDFLEYGPYFEALGIRTSLITNDTPASAYLTGGECINFSDNDALILARNEAKAESKDDFEEPVKAKRCLLLDEADSLLHDRAGDPYNYAEFDEARGDYVSIYEPLLAFVESSKEITTKSFKDFLDSKGLKKVKGLVDKLDTDALQGLLDTAEQAKELKLGKNYSISEVPSLAWDSTTGQTVETKVIVPTESGKPLTGSSFSGLLQGMITAKENRRLRAEDKADDEMVVPAPTTVKRSTSVFEVANDYETVMGITGTTRHALKNNPVFNVHKLSYITIPRHEVSKRHDKPILLAKDEAAQQDKIAEEATGANPVLIICEDDNESEALYDNLVRKFSGKNIQRISALTSPGEYKALTDNAGSENTITISTAGQCGRGLNVKADNKNPLSVLLTYIPSSSDERQVRGRSGRGGQDGSSRMILNVAKENEASLALMDKQHSPIQQNPEQFVKNIQARKDQQQQCLEILSTFHSDVTAKAHQQDDIDLTDAEKIWSNKTQPALRSAFEQGRTDKFETILTEFSNGLPDGIKNDVKPTDYSQALKFAASVTSSSKMPAKPAQVWENTHAGYNMTYSSLFAQTRATLRGDRQLFANTRVWWKGEGELFAETKALLKGERGLFANVRCTMKRDDSEPSCDNVSNTGLSIQ